MDESTLKARRSHRGSHKRGRQKGSPTEARRLHDMAPIIQWNSRGLKINSIEIALLVQALLPVVFFFIFKKLEKVIQ